MYAADEQDRLEFWGMEMRAEGEVAESSEDGKREVHAWVEVQTVTDGASQAISRQCQTSPAGKFQN